MEQLRKRLQIEVAASGMGSGGVTLEEMLGRLGQCASGGAVPPDQLPWRLRAVTAQRGVPHCPRDRLARGSARPGGAARLRTAVDEDQHRAGGSDSRAAGSRVTRDRVRDLLEDLRLRRYLGHAVCPWCPGSSAAPRRTQAAASVGAETRPEPARYRSSASHGATVLPRPVVRYSTRDGRGWGHDDSSP